MDILVRDGEQHPNLLNNFDNLYFEEPHLLLTTPAFGWYVTLLDNAFKAGTEVPVFNLAVQGHNNVTVYNHLANACGEVTVTNIKAYLLSLSFSKKNWGFDPLVLNDQVTAHLTLQSGTRTYSPFVLNRLKPLDKVPEKWNMTHCRRALANGQFRELKCNGRYTDDYAFDAASNFQQGPVSNTAMIQTIVESPSGWWTSLDAGTMKVSICCHHFDSNSFILDLYANSELRKAA